MKEIKLGVNDHCRQGAAGIIIATNVSKSVLPPRDLQKSHEQITYKRNTLSTLALGIPPVDAIH